MSSQSRRGAVPPATAFLWLALGAFAADGAAAVSHLATGFTHACAVTAEGGLKCWGNNRAGQLGDENFDQRNATMDPQGLKSGVLGVAAGESHTCALTTGGAVKCFGFNDSGQLGVGEVEDGRRVTPRVVTGLGSGVAAIAAGASHTCALTAAGRVKCWGSNIDGQLGDGTTASRSAPVDVIEGAAAISAGTYHSCALMRTGGVKCWGGNSWGQLGTGNTTASLLPVDVVGLQSGVARISAGDDQTCAVGTSGALHCWGANRYTLTADESFAPVNTLQPAAIGGFDGPVATVSVGWAHTCAVSVAGVLKCWRANWSGFFSTNGGAKNNDQPTAVGGLEGGFTEVVAGQYHTCARNLSGGVKCWGEGQRGQLGNTVGFSSAIPVDVLFPEENYQALWWNPAESGWGVSLAHHGDTLFAAWYTYDRDGSPLWLVMPNGEKQARGIYSGALYRTSGPPYAAAWNGAQIGVTGVGSVTFTFTNADNGTFRYTVDGTTQTKPIVRQEYWSGGFPTCLRNGTVPRAGYQDLWWNAPGGSESGWGLFLAHQAETIFAAWYTYDAAGKPTWFVMPRTLLVGPLRRYEGPIYRTVGPSYDAVPWNPAQVTATLVGQGSLDLTFSGNSTFAYTINGVPGSKRIERQVYLQPATACYF